MTASRVAALRRRAGLLALAAAVSGLCPACRPVPPPREATFATMGTVASVIAGGRQAPRAEAYAAIAAGVMREVDEQLSLYKTNSELSRLNALAGSGQGMRPGDHLRANLELALRYGDLSHGTFDVTVGPIVRMWGFSGGRRPAAALTDAQVAAMRTRVDYRRIRLDGGQAVLETPGMVVDLGGIAKGYAVDVCCDRLRAQGARDFTVNLSGNMRCFGRPAPDRPWHIGVRDPFHAGEVIGSIDLENGMAVSTSGNYEQFVEFNGHRYAHIIDPRTGWPVEGMAGTTVIAPQAADADALSTALFVLGIAEGTAVVGKVPGAGALFIPDREPLEIHVTAGMARCFHPQAGYAGAVRVLAQP